MKTRKFLLGAMALTTVLFSACSKDDDATTTEKIQAKWAINQEISNDFYSGINHRDTIPGIVGEYADFRADGKVYSKFGSEFDTASYIVVNDSQINIDGELFTIQKLNGSEFHIYSKEIDGVDYYETTFQFKK